MSCAVYVYADNIVRILFNYLEHFNNRSISIKFNVNVAVSALL